MPLPNLPVPQFPNIPPFPGVPPLLREANASIANIVVGIQSARTLLQRFLGISPAPQWGLFNEDGEAVLVGDSVKAVDYRKDFPVSDYPIEEGGFQSYNKVETPYDIKVTFLKGGTVGDRANFLELCDSLTANRTDLFTVVTPEATYAKATVTHFDYRRTETSGANLLTVDLWMVEVRQAAAPEFTNTREPEGADPVNNGAVQAKPVPPIVAQERALEASGAVR